MSQPPDPPVLDEPDLATLRAWLLEALHEEGIDDAVLGEDGIGLPNGLGLDAEFGDASLNQRGAVKTITRTIAWHADFPEGLIEYQHSSGPDVRAATIAGFRQWARLDLEAIEDALPDAEQHCLHINYAFPAKDDTPARRRRVVLGPPARHARIDAADPAANADQAHPFCACCLYTNTMEAFAPLLESDEVLGLRLYALRNEDGSTEADCRVNGVDFPPGAEALRAYAATWPGQWLEFRKQYAVVCNPPAGSDIAAS